MPPSFRQALRIIGILMLGVVCSILLVMYADAQTVTAPAVEPNPWLAYLSARALELMTIVWPVISIWLVMRIRRWFGLNEDEKMRDSLQVAVENAAGKMVQRAGDVATALMMGSPSRNAALAEGLSYLKAAAPDAISHFKLSDGSLVEKMEAKLGLKLAEKPGS